MNNLHYEKIKSPIEGIRMVWIRFCSLPCPGKMINISYKEILNKYFTYEAMSSGGSDESLIKLFNIKANELEELSDGLIYFSYEKEYIHIMRQIYLAIISMLQQDHTNTKFLIASASIGINEIYY